MSILTIHRPRWTAAALVQPSNRGPSPAAMPTLNADEHVLYRSARDGRLIAVGTDAALHYRLPGGAWRRIAWIDLTAASWSVRTRSLELHGALPNGRHGRISIAADRTLAAFATERIAHLRILRHRVELRPGVFGIVEAVRVSDQAAPLWRVHLDESGYRDDPLLRQACRDVISELRSLTGC
ncbi:MAG TPA: hypothetical protein VJ851_17255 [Jatrophihabitans sp.]|nr:hypothetical protein [Jatrophihabitans sp.]